MYRRITDLNGPKTDFLSLRSMNMKTCMIWASLRCLLLTWDFCAHSKQFTKPAIIYLFIFFQGFKKLESVWNHPCRYLGTERTKNAVSLISQLSFSEITSHFNIGYSIYDPFGSCQTDMQIAFIFLSYMWEHWKTSVCALVFHWWKDGMQLEGYLPEWYSYEHFSLFMQFSCYVVLRHLIFQVIYCFWWYKRHWYLIWKNLTIVCFLSFFFFQWHKL